DLGGLTSPHDRELRARALLENQRPDLLREVIGGFQIWPVVEDAVENDRVRFRLRIVRTEVVQIHSVRHNRNRGLRREATHNLLLPIRGYRAAVDLPPPALLECAEPFVFHAIEPAATDRAFLFVHPSEYLVLDVV